LPGRIDQSDIAESFARGTIQINCVVSTEYTRKFSTVLGIVTRSDRLARDRDDFLPTEAGIRRGVTIGKLKDRKWSRGCESSRGYGVCAGALVMFNGF
jgi:hypothetical protein